MDLRPAPLKLAEWYEENKALFSPPVCNKLMHKDQLTIMFVGGPNTRTDFHLDQGSEFFYQIRGNMELPTIQQGRRKLVHIKEGQVFCLPSRVPHSPQRPEEGSLGLVVERKRDQTTEKDGLRWYADFEKCEEVLYERYFFCSDLGRDLVPVVKQYKESEEFKTGKRKGDSVEVEKSFAQDMTTDVPEPFDLKDWIKAHQEELDAGAVLNLFDGHPDKEFNVRIIGGGSTQSEVFGHETFFYQLKGEAVVEVDGRAESVTVPEDGCFVVDSGVPYTVGRPAGSLGMVVQQDPVGNKLSSSPEEKRQKTDT